MRTQKLTEFLFMCWLSRLRSASSRTSQDVGRGSCRNVSVSSNFIDRDSRLTTPQMIAAYGYPVETHHITTQDGYILAMHRIPRRRQPSSEKQLAGKVVLLQHGVLSSSADWVVMGPGHALAYLLWDAGYDVWMNNARGNFYSKGHKAKKADYWSFSFHEMGVQDLPAVIDFILHTTGIDRIHYIGHSMGTTMFYVLMSERPEYSKKIGLMISLAPVAYLSNVESPFLSFLIYYTKDIVSVLDRVGIEEFQPKTRGRELLHTTLCKDKAITQEMCSNILFLIAGYDSEQLNKEKLPVILSHVPAGTSTRVFLHFSQIAKSGRFQQMDLGDKEKNTARYGQPTPPLYNLGRISTPVALIYGDNDYLCSIQDVKKLKNELGNVVAFHRIPYAKFNHLDFLWANDAKKLLYDYIIRLLDEKQ